MVISSRENQLIKDTYALINDKKERTRTGLFAVEGARLSSEAARCNAEIIRTFVTEEAMKKYPEYLDSLLNESKEVYTITEGIADKLCDTKNPQGVIVVAKRIERKPDYSKGGLFIMLSGLQDPGNIGTILRTCDAMDVSGVILAECADIFSPKTLRSSMGCLFRLPFEEFDSSKLALEKLKSLNITTYAAALAKDAILLGDVCFDKSSCILIGNEGNGLRKEIIECCDKKVMIPMKGRAESLNAASAAAILIYTASINI